MEQLHEERTPADVVSAGMDIRQAVEIATGQQWWFAHKGEEQGIDWVWAFCARLMVGARAYDESVSTLPSGRTYYPSTWPLEFPTDYGLLSVLAHEAVHVIRMSKWGRFRWLWFALYLCGPLPLFASWFRVQEETAALREQFLFLATTLSLSSYRLYEVEIEKEILGPRYGWAGRWGVTDAWRRVGDEAIAAAASPATAEQFSVLAGYGFDVQVLYGPLISDV